MPRAHPVGTDRAPSRAVLARRWLLAAGLASALLLGPVVVRVLARPAQPVVFRLVVVQPGDTLWDIAAVHAAPGEDVRETVIRIRLANGLTDSRLVPGQVLRVPMDGP